MGKEGDRTLGIAQEESRLPPKDDRFGLGSLRRAAAGEEECQDYDREGPGGARPDAKPVYARSFSECFSPSYVRTLRLP